jgi:hypothetical protein
MAYTKKQSYQPTKTKEDVLEILEKGIEQFLSSDKWKQYLTFQATFHDYSFNNCISILAQRPNATYVAGFEAWKKGFNRYVKKGEKGIAILLPVFKKVKEKEEREDQKPNRTLVRFRIGYVYDYAQTAGDPLPEFSFAKRLEFHSDLYEKMRATCPFPIREADDCGGANGYFSYSDHSITILSSMSSAHKARCIIHEYAHGLLHDPKDKTEGSRPHRSIRELEAESVSFIVSHHFGLDTSEYAFGYISGWAGENAVQALKQSGARIQNAARKIIESVETKDEVFFEKGLNLKKVI